MREKNEGFFSINLDEMASLIRDDIERLPK